MSHTNEFWGMDRNLRNFDLFGELPGVIAGFGSVDRWHSRGQAIRPADLGISYRWVT